MHGLPELLRHARAGDSQARGELIARFYDRVAALVHRQMQQRLRPQQHALLRQLSTGDIVQEVFVDVLRGLDRWEGEAEEAFVALLATLVEHRLVDQVRRSQAARRDVRRVGDAGPSTAGVPAAGASPATLAGNQEQMAIYREVLAGFSDRERALLELRLEGGVEFGELAQRLAWPSADAARKAFHLVQARLLLRLRQRGIGPGGSVA
ncbi:MAG TPA: sigma-70 family RNA polymerase sigma factor [Planctomycetota bacterium]|nr:sigma-70 family RNA polymerase sigma factor [Planctomycetota bacterium]